MRCRVSCALDWPRSARVKPAKEPLASVMALAGTVLPPFERREFCYAVVNCELVLAAR
jgi:hypothetical protein